MEKLYINNESLYSKLFNPDKLLFLFSTKLHEKF